MVINSERLAQGQTQAPAKPPDFVVPVNPSQAPARVTPVGLPVAPESPTIPPGRLPGVKVSPQTPNLPLDSVSGVILQG